jgi:hypothetical protein
MTRDRCACSIKRKAQRSKTEGEEPMLKEFAEYLVSLKEPKLLAVGKNQYSDKTLQIVAPPAIKLGIIYLTAIALIPKRIK